VLLQQRTYPIGRVRLSRVPAPAAVLGGSALVALLSLLLGAAPTYDPWSWVIWGREITEGDLSTVNGPSWKPLPVIVTTLTGQLGDASPVIWVWVARTGAIAGVVLAFILARRLAGTVAGVAAAAGLALMPWWLRNGALGNSEGIMVALVFAAILAELDRRRGWAFVFLLGAAMLRPEAWPFVGLYALWLVLRDRRRLTWVAAGLASIPVLWLGPELWGSGNAFRASDRAQQPLPNSPAWADHPWLELIKDAIGTTPAVAVAGAVIAVSLALASKAKGPRRPVLGIVAIAAAWIGIVAVMTERGFSGNQRYLITPAALLIVAGAVGFGWLVTLAARNRRLGPVAAVLAGAAIGAAFMLPDADRLEPVLEDTDHQMKLVGQLEDLIDEAGGVAALKACGRAYTNAFMVPQVAWQLHVHTNEVALDPQAPAVIFHVKLGAKSPFYGPGLRDAAPHYRARQGSWVLTADCPSLYG
jgi:hypothetical protein